MTLPDSWLSPSFIAEVQARALLLDHEEALEMDRTGGADAKECGYCDHYCGGWCAEATDAREADRAVDEWRAREVDE